MMTQFHWWAWLTQLSLPIDWDSLPTFAQIWSGKGMAKEVICAKMTEYKVVQNAGISLTKGANVTLEVFLHIAV